jgi:hypothetical protein
MTRRRRLGLPVPLPPGAMTNEVLCKILCHNICCVIQAMYELGIEPTFWEAPAGEDISAAVSASVEPTLTPLVRQGRVRCENLAL